MQLSSLFNPALLRVPVHLSALANFSLRTLLVSTKQSEQSAIEWAPLTTFLFPHSDIAHTLP